MNKFDFKVFFSRVLPTTGIGALSGVLSSFLIALPMLNLAVLGSLVGLCFGFVYDQYKYHLSKINLNESKPKKYLDLLYRLAKVAVGGFVTGFAASYQATNNTQAAISAGAIGAMMAIGTLMSLDQMQ